MGQEEENTERVFPENPVRCRTDNVAETGKDIRLQSTTFLHLSGVQNER